MAEVKTQDFFKASTVSIHDPQLRRALQRVGTGFDYSEYIKLARAKGVSGRVVVWKHALRNALIPALTFAGVNLGNVVAGSLTTELVFAWPGLGRLAVIAMLNNDYPLLQGVVIVYTLLFVGAALLVDILYAYIDPRIRYA